MFGETSAEIKDPTPQQVLNDLHLYSTECKNVYIYIGRGTTYGLVILSVKTIFLLFCASCCTV